MNAEVAVKCEFRYTNGVLRLMNLLPSHFRDSAIAVLDGVHFAFCGFHNSVMVFEQCAAPVEINAVQHALHPKMNPTLQTFTGKMVSIIDTNINQIDIMDIAHSLSMICRYNGHVADFYSVAEHSVLICWWLRDNGYDTKTQAVGLIHDAPEYLTGDVTKPLKSVIGPLYRPIQNALWERVALRFNLPDTVPDIVHEADLRILMNEKAQGFLHDVNWGWETDPLEGVKLRFWSPNRARHEFRKECARLGIL